MKIRRAWDRVALYLPIMLMGINCPIRIGGVTVMPGDLVLGKEDGVVFIPAHLAEKVVKTAELVALRDKFGKQRLAEGKYTSGQIDTRWADDIEADFSLWLEAHIDELPVPREAIQEMLREQLLRRAGESLQAIRRRMPNEELTPEIEQEIVEAVQAYRAERRARRVG